MVGVRDSPFLFLFDGRVKHTRFDIGVDAVEVSVSVKTDVVSNDSGAGARIWTSTLRKRG
jgi:hypothetical protein